MTDTTFAVLTVPGQVLTVGQVDALDRLLKLQPDLTLRVADPANGVLVRMADRFAFTLAVVSGPLDAVSQGASDVIVCLESAYGVNLDFVALAELFRQRKLDVAGSVVLLFPTGRWTVIHPLPAVCHCRQHARLKPVILGPNGRPALVASCCQYVDERLWTEDEYGRFAVEAMAYGRPTS